MNIPFKLISEYNQTNQTYRLVICVYILLCVNCVKVGRGRAGGVLL